MSRGVGEEATCEEAARRPGGTAERLRLVVDVRDEDARPLLWAMLYLFSLLAGNYLIRPVRDEMGIAGGTSYLPALFSGTLLAILVAAPLASARLRRRDSPGFVAGFRAIQLTLCAFFVAFRTLPAAGQVHAARGFFLWASVINLLVVSIGWGTLSSRFSSEQARRLFGLIAAGGTLGAIAGSALAGILAERAGTSWLLLPAAAFLELAVLSARRLHGKAENRMPGADRTEAPADPSPRESPSPSVSRYLAGLGVWTLLFTSTSAVIYMEQARIVDATIREPASRTAFFARIDLLVNLLGLILQLTLTGPILAHLGAGVAAAVLPTVTLAGVVVLVTNPTLATVKWFQVIRRAVDYAVARPGREVFYTVVRRTELLRTKGMIDTAVYRAGDAAGAWAYGLIAATPALASTAPLAVVPLSLIWIALSLGLGRAMARLSCPGELARATESSI